MANHSNLNEIIQRILNGTQTDSDVEALRQWLNSGGIQNLQVGKYNVNIGQGQDIQIGDTFGGLRQRTYQGLDAEAIREVARSVLQGSNAADIREVVHCILKEEFPNLTQRENPQSSSGNSRTPENNLQSILNNVQVGGHLSIGHITQICGAGEVIQPVNTSEDSPLTNTGNSVDDLVQQVRSHIHDTIQSLHGTMPLWGIDHCVPLGELFVDVNILESLSSSRRSEQDDLWQDFITGHSTYRSLDRIGLGKEQQRVSGLTVLERNTNLMVVGKPGSGKTTYLQRIVTECNAGKLQAQRIPVLIKLREFVEDGRKYVYNLEQFLGQQWGLRNTDIKLVLNQGRALVLLDGLDEVTGEAGKQIAKEIKRFARVYPQVQVVVTCRTQSQESRFERFDYVEVANFNHEEQVRVFAQHWFETVCADAEEGETQAQDFLSQLFRQENKPIRELAITPILLSLTCAVFHQTGKFYSKRSKLYEEGLELLLEQWDKSREVERDEIYRDLSVERKLELLSFLAVKKFEQEKYVLFAQEELERYIAEFLGIERRDSRRVLRAIESQHGLLIERAQKVWSFSHLTFQEYLIAKHIVDNRQIEELVANHLTDEHWLEIFILVSELMSELGEAENLLLNMEQKTQAYICTRRVQTLLYWVDIITMGSKSNTNLVAKRAAALFIFITLAIAYGFGHNFARTRHLILDLVSISNSKLAGLLDYTLAFITDIGHDFSLNMSCAKTVQESGFLNISDNLLHELNALEVMIAGDSETCEMEQDDIETLGLNTWLSVLEIDVDMLNLTLKEVEVINDFLYANTLMLRCKEAVIKITPKIWELIENKMLTFIK